MVTADRYDPARNRVSSELAAIVGPMSHVLGLARILDELDNDEAFLDALDRAFHVLLGADPLAAGTLIALLSDRVDRTLGAMTASCCDAHDGPHVHGCTLDRGPGGAPHPGACHVSRETGVTNGANVSRETDVTCPHCEATLGGLGRFPSAPR